jgi:glycosyltransferase involved in cell wall biosynthesis
MKIAQIAPLAESCPPQLYGGTERIVSYLTEELARKGHDVTLFASGDSTTSANLVSVTPMALRLNPNVKDTVPYHVMMLEEVRRRAHEFDVLHFHLDFLHYPLMRDYADRMVTTLHGRLDLPDLQPFYAAFPDFPVVSISDAQRKPMPPVNWAGTVHHGLPRNLLPFMARPKGDYLAFLGRISPEKRPDRAIEIAARTGMKLKIAAKIDNADRADGRDASQRRVRRRDQRATESRFPRQRVRAALPDRLAGAVRSCHDRGHGLRHARGRVPLRFRAGGDRRRRLRLHRQGRR